MKKYKFSVLSLIALVSICSSDVSAMLWGSKLTPDNAKRQAQLRVSELEMLGGTCDSIR